jgi:hypothetical protein
LQKEIHAGLKRWNVLVCHRRFGKTVLCINELIKKAMTCKLERPRYAYLAPLYRQAKSIAWDYLKHYSAPIPGVKINESELRVDYPNGARIQLHGADNPDALRGIYLDGVVLDEYAQMAPRVFTEILRPALSDRKGWAIFIGTPQGKNAFYDLYHEVDGDRDWLCRTYRASETGIIAQEELDAARKIMDADEYEQEFECSWSAAIKGAYYGTQINDLEKGGRIIEVPHDPSLPVNTHWDLGVGDATAIWFEQRVGHEVRIIDYYENSGEGLAHYVRYLQAKPYIWGKHYAPHDIEVRELGTGKSRKETAASLGIRFDVTPNLPVDDGIDAVRRILPLCWFDKHKCKLGIEALKNYRHEWDDKRQVFRNTPLHDWTSHAADAFRYLAVNYKRLTDKPKTRHTVKSSWMGM